MDITVIIRTIITIIRIVRKGRNQKKREIKSESEKVQIGRLIIL